MTELARSVSEPPLSAVVPPRMAISEDEDKPIDESDPFADSVNDVGSPVPQKGQPAASENASDEVRSHTQRYAWACVSRGRGLTILTSDIGSPNMSSSSSTWSVLSSPRSTQYHSPARHLSPERPPTQSSHIPQEVSRHATGGTFASETSSGLVTPVSAGSLIFSLAEQIAAQRAQGNPARIDTNVFTQRNAARRLRLRAPVRREHL